MNLFNHFDTCLLCASNLLKPLLGYEKNYLVKCQTCHFVFCQRKPSDLELTAHYGAYPRGSSISDITIKRYETLLDQFEQYRKTNNLLDVGCGDGFFLAVAKKRNWNVFGTEFTNEAIAECRQKGIAMTHSPLNPTHYDSDFFDVITSFEVIEHINNPVAEVATFNTLLRSGGMVYITTPNFNSVSRNLLKGSWNIIEYPEHLCYYTPQTLSTLFKIKKYKKVELSTTGLSIQRLRSGFANGSTANSDEVLRQKTENKFIFKAIKTMLNWILNMTKKGDAMKALFQKP